MKPEWSRSRNRISAADSLAVKCSWWQQKRDQVLALEVTARRWCSSDRDTDPVMLLSDAQTRLPTPAP
jgi:hypothetical protein